MTRLLAAVSHPDDETFGIVSARLAAALSSGRRPRKTRGHTLEALRTVVERLGTVGAR